ncbi:hypothetical protein JCM1841_002427 [Sporobolomyces salmonicolor]
MASTAIPASRFLPSLHPVPPVATVLSVFHQLDDNFDPSNVVIDLREPLEYPQDRSGDAGLEPEEETNRDRDEFELNFARNWLQLVISVGTKQIGKGDDGAMEWEKAIDLASRLLAAMAGPSASGDGVKTYLLPFPPRLPPLHPPIDATTLAFPTPPPTRPPSTVPSSPIHSPLSLKIHDGTLLGATTGHRTWASAPILARRFAISPFSFFRPSSILHNGPLRVLELGAGTGLVGLSVLAVLDALCIPSTVVLSDGGEPGVMDNLRLNAARFTEEHPDCIVSSEVQEIRWDDHLPSPAGKGVSLPDHARFDLVFGADLVYEPAHAELLYAAAAAHLRFPGPDPDRSHSSTPKPAFHLVLPLRRTHATESRAVETIFPLSSCSSPSRSTPSSPSPAPPLDSNLIRTDARGRKFRLATTSREELAAPDGFGDRARVPEPRGSRRGGAGWMKYVLRVIEWQEVEDVD